MLADSVVDYGSATHLNMPEARLKIVLDFGVHSKVYTMVLAEQARMLTIGKLAAIAEISTDSLRYYEREGLVRPASLTRAGYRLYGEDSAQRIQFIKHAQACGFTLAEIRELLELREHTTACCSDVRRLAVEKKLQIEARIKALKTMSKALDIMISNCAGDAIPVGECAILAALEEAKSGKKP